MQGLKEELGNDISFDKNTSVTKDIESYTDIIGRQLLRINELMTENNNFRTIGNAIGVLAALFSPYLPEEYKEELRQLEQETWLKLRVLRSDSRHIEQNNIFTSFLEKKYSILLQFAKTKGFLPKDLSWEY